LSKGALSRINNSSKMPTIRQSETFSGWLHDLRDAKARTKILVRI